MKASKKRFSRLAVAASVAALSLSAAADTRFWSDANGDTASFNAVDSWDPAPSAMSDVASDTLVLNKGVDKIATVGNGDNVSVGTLYVGWGTLDGTSMGAANDKGGRLDVTGGLLSVTNTFRLGGPYSDNSNNVVNVTGGRVVASKLRTSDCSNSGGRKSETINVSGTGVFEIAADEALLATYSGGETFVNVTAGGTFTGDQHLDIGRSGKATFTLDGGTVFLTDNNKSVNVGRHWHGGGSGNGKLEIKSGSWTSGYVNVGQGEGGATTGELVISGGTVEMRSVKVGVHTGTGTFRLSNVTVNTTSDSGIGINSNSKGTMIIDSGKFASAGNQFRVGEKGVGVLTMNGGELTANYALELNGNSESVAEGTTLNLNGGKITVGQINSKTTLTTATINWNGGTLTSNGMSDGQWGGFFPKNDYIKINVLSGGAVYETREDRGTNSEKIDQPMSGVGAFTKRGPGTLSLNGALNLKGGFKVEGGTLNVASLDCTTLKEISVAENCTLDLGGASVKVERYVVNGSERSSGTYTAHNGTVHVMSAEELTPVSARWTNAAGDGDVANPDNWVSLNAAGEEIPVAPTSATPITVVYVPGGMTFDGFSDVTWIVENDTCAEGYRRPEVLQTAVAWYDPSEYGKYSIAGDAVVALYNKGTAGSALDLQLRDANKGGPARVENAFNGTPALHFDNNSGFVSTGYFPDSFIANGERTMFAVAQGDVNNMIMLTIAQGSKNTEEGKGMLLAHKADSGNYGCAYKIGYKNPEDSNWKAGKASFDAVVSDTPYVFAGRTTLGDGDERKVISSAMSADGTKIGQLEPTSFNMPDGEEETRFNVYYGSFEVNIGWLLQNDTVGYQGEALIFTNALDDAEMDAVNAYLRGKWLNTVAVMPEFEKIVVNAEIDLGGATRTFDSVSGSGSFVDGTVVLTGDLVVTVNPDETVVVPTFDKLVLGPAARLVVMGAKNLPIRRTINILPFNSLEGEFSSVVGEKGVIVKCRYLEDHVCASRDAGMRISLR